MKVSKIGDGERKKSRKWKRHVEMESMAEEREKGRMEKDEGE